MKTTTRKLMAAAAGLLSLGAIAVAQNGAITPKPSKPTETLGEKKNKSVEAEAALNAKIEAWKKEASPLELAPAQGWRVMDKADREAAEEKKQHWAWIFGEWKETDVLYLQIKRTIDAEFLQAKTPPAIKAINDKYAAQAKARATDSAAVFAYAYANRKAAAIGPVQTYADYGLVKAFEKVPTPQAYEYVRLRFIAEGVLDGQPELVPLGSRLLVKNPDDTTVMFVLSNMLDPDDAKERQLFATLNQTLLKKFPNDAGLLDMRSGFYHAAYLSTKKLEDKQKALQAYQKYLTLVPRDSPAGQAAIGYIKSLRSS